MVIIISRLKRSDIWRDIDTDLADVAADDAADAGLEVEADDDEADASGRDERVELVHPGKTNKPQIGCSTGTNLIKNLHQSQLCSILLNMADKTQPDPMKKILARTYASLKF